MRHVFAGWIGLRVKAATREHAPAPGISPVCALTDSKNLWYSFQMMVALSSPALAKPPRWLMAVLAGALLGVVLGGVFHLFAGVTASSSAAAGLPLAGDPLARLAVDYAHAYQHGDWDFVFAHTLWIQDRLTYAAAHGEEPNAEEEARLSLMASVSDRSVAGNQLLEGGVADQYVFRPGARVELTGVDAGRDGLHRPTALRAWLRVVYPSPENALLDGMGLPVEALTVGVNMTSTGHVLKASVYGNVEIDWNSVVYQRVERALM